MIPLEEYQSMYYVLLTVDNFIYIVILSSRLWLTRRTNNNISKGVIILRRSFFLKYIGDFDRICSTGIKGIIFR